MSWLKWKLVVLSSFSPFFSCSVDDLFGAIAEDTKVRFSLVNFYFWKFNICILSWYNGFSLFKIVNLDTVKAVDVKNIAAASELYYLRLNENKDLDVESEIDLIMHKIEGYRDSSQRNHSKYSIYIAVVAIFISFIGVILNYVLKNSSLLDLDVVAKLAFFLVFWFLLNTAMYLLLMPRVTKSIRSRFADLKKESSRKKFASLLYFDWRNMMGEHDLLTSHMRNLERNLIRLTLAVFLLAVVYFSMISSEATLTVPFLMDVPICV